MFIFLHFSLCDGAMLELGFPEHYCAHTLPLDPSRQSLTQHALSVFGLSPDTRAEPEGGVLTLCSGQCAPLASLSFPLRGLSILKR